jgi:hypothetical protein
MELEAITRDAFTYLAQVSTITYIVALPSCLPQSLGRIETASCSLTSQLLALLRPFFLLDTRELRHTREDEAYIPKHS